MILTCIWCFTGIPLYCRSLLMDIWRVPHTSQIWRSAPMMSCWSITQRKYVLEMFANTIPPYYGHWQLVLWCKVAVDAGHGDFGVSASHLKGRHKKYVENASGMFHNTCLCYVISCFCPNGHPLVIVEKCNEWMQWICYVLWFWQHIGRCDCEKKKTVINRSI